jgi:hypothetical protein
MPFSPQLLCTRPLKEPGWNTQTAAVAESAKLPLLWAGTRLHAALCWRW